MALGDDGAREWTPSSRRVNGGTTRTIQSEGRPEEEDGFVRAYFERLLQKSSAAFCWAGVLCIVSHM